MLYDPFTYDTLMAGMVLRFEQQPLLDLAKPIEARGPGIYSLLYIGDFDAYNPITKKDWPIYVGRATPSGSRRGSETRSRNSTGWNRLQKRLEEHRESLNQAKNLRIEHFKYRALPTEPVWIDIAERFLIRSFRPVMEQLP